VNEMSRAARHRSLAACTPCRRPVSAPDLLFRLGVVRELDLPERSLSERLAEYPVADSLQLLRWRRSVRRCRRGGCGGCRRGHDLLELLARGRERRHRDKGGRAAQTRTLALSVSVSLSWLRAWSPSVYIAAGVASRLDGAPERSPAERGTGGHWEPTTPSADSTSEQAGRGITTPLQGRVWVALALCKSRSGPDREPAGVFRFHVNFGSVQL
jgi:hypothetical protein